MQGGKEEAGKKKGAVFAPIIFKDCDISAGFLDKLGRRALPSLPAPQETLSPTQAGGGLISLSNRLLQFSTRPWLQIKPDHPAGLASAESITTCKDWNQGFLLHVQVPSAAESSGRGEWKDGRTDKSALSFPRVTGISDPGNCPFLGNSGQRCPVCVCR